MKKIVLKMKGLLFFIITLFFGLSSCDNTSDWLENCYCDTTTRESTIPPSVHDENIAISVAFDFKNAESIFVDADLTITNTHQANSISLSRFSFLDQLSWEKKRGQDPLTCSVQGGCGKKIRYKKNKPDCIGPLSYVTDYYLQPNQSATFNGTLRVDKRLFLELHWAEIKHSEVEDYVSIATPYSPSKEQLEIREKRAKEIHANDPQTLAKAKEKVVVDGTTCWDLDGDGKGDPEEDTNGDGMFDGMDCQGLIGPQGSTGPQGDVGCSGWLSEYYFPFNNELQESFRDSTIKNVVIHNRNCLESSSYLFSLFPDAEGLYSNSNQVLKEKSIEFSQFLSTVTCPTSFDDRSCMNCFQLNEELEVFYDSDTIAIFNKGILVKPLPKMSRNALDFLQQSSLKEIVVHLDKEIFNDIIAVEPSYSVGKGTFYGANTLNSSEFLTVLSRAADAGVTLRLRSDMSYSSGRSPLYFR